MFNVVTQLENDAVEMRKVYAGAVRRQIEAGAPIIALEADLMRLDGDGRRAQGSPAARD